MQTALTAGTSLANHKTSPDTPPILRSVAESSLKVYDPKCR
jgi:hypothetical protein